LQYIAGDSNPGPYGDSLAGAPYSETSQNYIDVIRCRFKKSTAMEPYGIE